jgi:hypothetical protein
MRTHGFRLAPFLLACLALLILLAPREAAARRGRNPPELRAHEWGVWLFDRGVITIDDLVRESPPFVHRAGGAGPVVPDRDRAVPEPPPQPALKPVIFFHASHAVDVDVRVGFRRGAPWLYYPGGTPARVGHEAGLRFTGRVHPSEPGTVSQPVVATGHFWNHLRAASDTVFRASNGESDAFIFYDGPSEVERPVTATRSGASVALHARIARTTTYVIDRRHYLEAQPSPDATVTLASIASTGRPTDALEPVLTEALRTNGLTLPEATSLVRTWHHELFETERLHVVTILPRAAYDAALPITISPRPTEFVRVGVIIERL